MPEWIPPKTNWSVEDVPGLEDFKRIEGNTEYLKEQVDGLKTGNIKAGNAEKLGNYTVSYFPRYILPSNDVILQANAERSVWGDQYQRVKQFRVWNPGVYRVKFEMKGEDSEASVTINDVNVGATSSSYKEYVVDVTIRDIPGEIVINLRGGRTSDGRRLSGWIRNVKVCGKFATAPSNEVLQN